MTESGKVFPIFPHATFDFLSHLFRLPRVPPVLVQPPLAREPLAGLADEVDGVVQVGHGQALEKRFVMKIK